MIDIVKASAVVSVIAVTDLMRVGQQLSSASYRPLEVYTLAACFYLAITSVLSLAGRGLERRWPGAHEGAMNSFLSLVPRFVAAMFVTLEVSLLAACLGALGGFALNALRLRCPRAVGGPYRVFVWLIRGTPYLSQLVIVYFGLPALGVTMTAIQATIVSLALYSAAYFAEIFRAGWASIPRGHLEAARAFGTAGALRS